MINFLRILLFNSEDMFNLSESELERLEWLDSDNDKDVIEKNRIFYSLLFCISFGFVFFTVVVSIMWFPILFFLSLLTFLPLLIFSIYHELKYKKFKRDEENQKMKEKIELLERFYREEMKERS